MHFSKLVISTFIAIASTSASSVHFEERDFLTTTNAHDEITENHSIVSRDGLSGVVENCCCCMCGCVDGYNQCINQLQTNPNVNLAAVLYEMNSHISTAISEGSNPLMGYPQEIGRFVVNPIVESVSKGTPLVLKHLSKGKASPDATTLSYLNTYHSLVNQLINEGKRYNVNIAQLSLVSNQVKLVL